ncbi:MAG: vWA domain-containing protein, partial [Chloroflexota bacterium]
PEDVSLVVLFETTILNRDFDDWIVEGNDPAELRDLYLQIEDESAGGGTNIFGAALEAYQELEDIREDRDCLPSVIVMTDGADREGLYGDFERYISRTENDIPVFAITFGNADEEELIPMTDLTFGRLFDGTEDLIEAFRSAKGYN